MLLRTFLNPKFGNNIKDKSVLKRYTNKYYSLKNWRKQAMNVQIQSIHFDADKKLLSFIQEKVDKLNHFHDGIIEGTVFLKLEKADSAENKVAEIKLHVSGQDLFAKRNCHTFEEAVDTSIDALTKQLKKHKEKVKGI